VQQPERQFSPVLHPLGSAHQVVVGRTVVHLLPPDAPVPSQPPERLESGSGRVHGQWAPGTAHRLELLRKKAHDAIVAAGLPGVLLDVSMQGCF
jgi:hypothetical protein